MGAMKKGEIVIIGVVLLIIAAGFSYVLMNKGQQKLRQVKINDKSLGVTVAATPAELEKGLMDVKTLPQNEGMLFVFASPDYYGFWMRNTLIPLDIIWLDENKKIVYIKENAQPCVADPKNELQAQCETFMPKSKAMYVIEVNSGWVEKNGVKIGNKVIF
jgi:uncharacterized membrane protein (UPF0127 family)